MTEDQSEITGQRQMDPTKTYGIFTDPNARFYRLYQKFTDCDCIVFSVNVEEDQVIVQFCDKHVEYVKSGFMKTIGTLANYPAIPLLEDAIKNIKKPKKLDDRHGCVVNKMGTVYEFTSKDNSRVIIYWCEYCNATEVLSD